MGATQLKQAAPMATIHQAMTPAGPLRAAVTWATALPAAAPPTKPTLTRPALTGVLVPRRLGRRDCWFMVLLAAGRCLDQGLYAGL